MILGEAGRIPNASRARGGGLVTMDIGIVTEPLVGPPADVVPGPPGSA